MCCARRCRRSSSAPAHSSGAWRRHASFRVSGRRSSQRWPMVARSRGREVHVLLELWTFNVSAPLERMRSVVELASASLVDPLVLEHRDAHRWEVRGPVSRQRRCPPRVAGAVDGILGRHGSRDRQRPTDLPGPARWPAGVGGRAAVAVGLGWRNSARRRYGRSGRRDNHVLGFRRPLELSTGSGVPRGQEADLTCQPCPLACGFACSFDPEGLIEALYWFSQWVSFAQAVASSGLHKKVPRRVFLRIRQALQTRLDGAEWPKCGGPPDTCAVCIEETFLTNRRRGAATASAWRQRAASVGAARCQTPSATLQRPRLPRMRFGGAARGGATGWRVRMYHEFWISGGRKQVFNK